MKYQLVKPSAGIASRKKHALSRTNGSPSMNISCSEQQPSHCYPPQQTTHQSAISITRIFSRQDVHLHKLRVHTQIKMLVHLHQTSVKIKPFRSKPVVLARCKRSFDAQISLKVDGRGLRQCSTL